MSAYRDALTRMFLKGAFPDRPVMRGHVSVALPQAVVRAPSPAPVRREKPIGRPRVATPKAALSKAENPAVEFPHPGRRLADKLAEKRLSASDLARDIGVPVNRVTAVINGQRSVTADTALRLGHWFDETPESWMLAQQLYELARARETAGVAISRLPRLSARAP